MADGCRSSEDWDGGQTLPPPLSCSQHRSPSLKNWENPTPKHTPRRIQVAAAHRKEGEDECGRMGMEAEAPAGGRDGWTDKQSDPGTRHGENDGERDSDATRKKSSSSHGEHCGAEKEAL